VIFQQNVTIPKGTHTVSIGGGGVTGAINGANTLFMSNAAQGGGGEANDGGSGGGGEGFANGSPSGGTGVPGQGYSGGTANNDASYVEKQAGGGGGGALGLGEDGVPSVAGNGGAGQDFAFAFGTTVGVAGWFASGGGGGKRDGSSGSGTAPIGGGGAGGNNSIDGEDGTPNTGGGGGGGKASGAGGSGVFIIMYDPPASGGTSKVSGIVQIDGTPAERTVRAFGYNATDHDIDGEPVTLSKSLGHSISDSETGEYTIDLLGGYL
jgi:hypothetical protein